MFVGVDAELATRSALVDTATKCLAIAASSPSASTTHARAESALVSVSSVPKVFDETMNSVSSASRSRVASTKSVESTFETKRKVRSRSRVVAQRLVGHHRAEVGAADADVDDVADRLAGVALPLARAHAVAERAIRSSTSWTSATTSTPSTTSDVPFGMRSATCSTARFSETLMCSPRNIASRALASPDSSASWRSSRIVSSVMRFFE